MRRPGKTHSRPPRCTDSAPGVCTRASWGRTSSATDPSRAARTSSTAAPTAAAAASHQARRAPSAAAGLSAPGRGTTSAPGTSISRSWSPPSPGASAASAAAGAMVTLPARCSTDRRNSVREASLTLTCASPTLSTSSPRRSRSPESGRPLKRTTAPGVGCTSHNPARRLTDNAAPGSTPGTTTSDPVPPIDSVSPSTRSPPGSRTRTWPHAPGCIDTPSFMRSSDRLGTADVHRLALLTGADRDIAAHVAISVARADHGVVARLELDVAPGETAERAHARYRHLREAVRQQRQVHGLFELRQHRGQARHLYAQRRAGRGLLLRRLQQRDRLIANLRRGQPVGAIDQRLQGILELHVRRSPGLALLGKDERAILTQHRVVGLQRLVPALLRLETFGPRAHRGEAALAAGRIDAPQALERLGPVGAQAAGSPESGARFIEASRTEGREALARRPGVTVVAGGGGRLGQPRARLRVLRIERQRLRVVLRRARILPLLLRVLGVREQRQNARQAARSALPDRGPLILRIDARGQIEGLGRQLLLAGGEGAIAGGELGGERRGGCALDRIKQPRGLRQTLLRERQAPRVGCAGRLGGARLGRGEVRPAPDTRAARLEHRKPA